jgi:tRNA dimethylallyltransferase
MIALVGPTAAGKTPLAVELARAIGAEIVSVDSRQVYRHLDIGTAKPDARSRAAVPHHLLDVVEPDRTFDAAAYATLARSAIADVLGRSQHVVLCGGSGLYLRALTEGLCSVPAADPDLRARLHALAEREGLDVLHRRLAVVDPAAAARIAPQDRLRTVRALEVLELTGRPLSEWQRAHAFDDRPYDLLTFVLSPPSALLETRIAGRAAAMWQGGLVEETERVLALGFSPDLPALCAIGYREAIRHLTGEIDRETALDATIRATRQYAKRQRTWFRKLERAIWLDAHDELDRDGRLGELASRCAAFLDAPHVS